MSIYKYCENCGRIFVGIRNSKKYCGLNCKTYSYRARRIEKQKRAEEMAVLREMLQEQKEYRAKMKADFENFKASFATNKNQSSPKPDE